MISKYTYKSLAWIDLENPTDKELTHVIEEYKVPVIVGEEMKARSLHSKVDVYPNFIYVILHFPKMSSDQNSAFEQEVDFILSKDFIITTHYEHVDALHEFSKDFEVEAVLEKRMDIDHAGFLFYHLIKTLYQNSRKQLHLVNNLLKDIEKKIFEGKEGEMVVRISNINRTLLDFRQALRFHKEVLDSFEIAAKQFFGEKFNYYISSITGEYNKTQKILDEHKEILDDLHQTNNSLLANKTNETIKILTIVTFIISPVTVISSLFMMNTEFPLLHTMNEFYLVILSMLIVIFIIYLYIRRKKWL